MIKVENMNKKGSILILGLLVMAILLLIGGVFLSLTLINLSHINIDTETIQAFWIAYAGLERTIHDLKDDFGTHQQELIEFVFGEGKAKIGTVPLQQQGVREILIVSTGYKRKNSSSIAGRVKIDSTTDYVLFSEGDIIIDSSGGVADASGKTYNLGNGWNYSYQSYYFAGPMYINGNLKVRIIIRTTAQTKIIFAKSKDISGPALSLSGILFYYPPGVNTGNMGSVVNDLNGIAAGEADIRSNADRFLLTYDDFIWNGRRIDFGWDDADHYPTYTADPGSTIDMTGSRVFQDKYHSGYKIKIPYMEDITYEKYGNFVDNSWYIKDTNFSNFACKQISFTNDALLKKEIIATGKWDGVSVPSSDDYTFDYSPSNRAIRNVYVVKSNTTDKYMLYGGYSEQPYYNTITQWLFLPLSEYDPDGTNINTEMMRKYPSWTAENGVLTLKDTRHEYINWLVHISSYNYHYGRRRIELSASHGIPIDRKIKEVIFGANDGTPSYGEGDNLVLGTAPVVGVDAMVLTQEGASIPRRAIIFPKMHNATGNPATQYTWGSKFFRLYNDTSSYLAYPKNTYMEGESGSGGIISPPPLENTVGDDYDRDYPPSSPSSDSFTGTYPFPSVSSEVGYYDVYVKDFGTNTWNKKTKDIDYTVPADGAYVSGGTTNPNSHYIQFVAGKEPVVNSTIAINRRHNLPGDNNPNSPDHPDPGKYPEGFVFAKIYPPEKDCKILIDSLVEAVKINLDAIDKNNCPKDWRFPSGFQDYNKNGIQEQVEPGKYGIIYSKVPLVISGSPKVPVTIICEDDVYVQSINKKYAIDDLSAQPVGIISKKVIWIDHSAMNNNNADTEDKEVMLNKVALFTNATRLFHYGGTAPSYGNPIDGFKYMNKTRLIGSLCIVQLNSKGEKTTSTDIDGNREAKYEGGVWSAVVGTDTKHQSYANSFRYDPPRHMPIDFKILTGRKGAAPSNAESFYTLLMPYANENKNKLVPVEVYQQLLNELEK